MVLLAILLLFAIALGHRSFVFWAFGPVTANKNLSNGERNAIFWLIWFAPQIVLIIYLLCAGTDSTQDRSSGFARKSVHSPYGTKPFTYAVEPAIDEATWLKQERARLQLLRDHLRVEDQKSVLDFNRQVAAYQLRLKAAQHSLVATPSHP